MSKVGLMLTQCAYIPSILKEFKMDDVNPISITFLEELKLGHELDVALLFLFIIDM
jgi:hypothetical protein